MAKYRKKPVVIEAWDSAVEFPPDDAFHVRQHVNGRYQVYDFLHGTWVNFDEGDWIIKGVKGEFYPCKPDVFAVTYDPEPE